MKKFIVGVEEVYITNVEVMAETYEEAIELAESLIAAGEEDLEAPEYSHTLDPEMWTVSESE
jgi:hypothetical protein